MPEEQVPLQLQQFVDVRQVSRQSEEFADLYANNVLFEANAFDLRVIFGQFKAGAKGEPEIEQHTAVAIPWSVAKIACMYLAMNIIAFESDHGADAIHLLPSMLGMLRLNEKAKADPRIMTIFTALMSAGNPEIFSGPIIYAKPPAKDGEEPNPQGASEPPGSAAEPVLPTKRRIVLEDE